MGRVSSNKSIRGWRFVSRKQNIEKLIYLTSTAKSELANWTPEILICYENPHSCGCVCNGVYIVHQRNDNMHALIWDYSRFIKNCFFLLISPDVLYIIVSLQEDGYLQIEQLFVLLANYESIFEFMLNLTEKFNDLFK